MSESDDFISIESMIADSVLLEMDLEAARKTQAEIHSTRAALKESVQAENDITANRVYEMRVAIQKFEQERREAVASITAAHADMADAEFDARREVRKQQDLFDSMQRQIDQKRRAELVSAEWQTLEKRWDTLTMGAPWREWAKDHQLSGARKITYEGRMILADTMGLGKTLTSLIAIDMIEAATKDASPDNPVEFGSMK